MLKRRCRDIYRFRFTLISKDDKRSLIEDIEWDLEEVFLVEKAVKNGLRKIVVNALLQCEKLAENLEEECLSYNILCGDEAHLVNPKLDNCFVFAFGVFLYLARDLLNKFLDNFRVEDHLLQKVLDVELIHEVLLEEDPLTCLRVVLGEEVQDIVELSHLRL